MRSLPKIPFRQLTLEFEQLHQYGSMNAVCPAVVSHSLIRKNF